MKVYYVKGFGQFTNEEGLTVNYPINKIRIQPNKGGNDWIEMKLSKEDRRVLPYLFDMEKLANATEDDNGNQCDIYILKDKNIQSFGTIDDLDE